MDTQTHKISLPTDIILDAVEEELLEQGIVPLSGFFFQVEKITGAAESFDVEVEIELIEHERTE